MFISTLISPVMMPFWILRDIAGITNNTIPEFTELNMILH
jgi:hypothetical protein